MRTQKKGSLPAELRRAQRYGTANQMAYKQEQKIQREALQDRLASQRRERLARAGSAQRRQAASRTKGSNAGTVGGSRR